MLHLCFEMRHAVVANPVFLIAGGRAALPMSSSMGPRKRQEFLGLGSIPCSEAGACGEYKRCTRGSWRKVRDAEEKNGLQAKAPL